MARRRKEGARPVQLGRRGDTKGSRGLGLKCREMLIELPYSRKDRLHSRREHVTG